MNKRTFLKSISSAILGIIAVPKIISSSIKKKEDSIINKEEWISDDLDFDLRILSWLETEVENSNPTIRISKNRFKSLYNKLYWENPLTTIDYEKGYFAFSWGTIKAAPIEYFNNTSRSKYDSIEVIGTDFIATYNYNYIVSEINKNE